METQLFTTSDACMFATATVTTTLGISSVGIDPFPRYETPSATVAASDGVIGASGSISRWVLAWRTPRGQLNFR